MLKIKLEYMLSIDDHCFEGFVLAAWVTSQGPVYPPAARVSFAGA